MAQMDTENRPVLTGLIALVGVALVIGVLGGLGILVVVKAAGIGGSSDASSDSSASATFSLPKVTDTGSGVPVPEETVDPGTTVPETETPTDAISLSASQLTVSPMQQVDLTGTYPTGEGAILQVQRFEDGAWQDFPVTMSVSGSTFATYVQTSRVGPNKFRVIDTDTEKVSNEITVTVG
jgi:hypothetical protein